jgi:hypothetical protein
VELPVDGWLEPVTSDETGGSGLKTVQRALAAPGSDRSRLRKPRSVPAMRERSERVK